MKMKTNILLSLLLLLTINALAQSAKPVIRSVSVSLEDGTSLTGELVKFEDDALLLKSAIGETKISLGKISKIEFNKAQSTAPYTPAAQQLIKSSRALSSGAYDLTLLQYRTRVADLKAELDEILRTDIPKTIKTPLVLAVTYHDLVVGAWPSGRNNTPAMRKLWEEALQNANNEIDKAETALKSN